MPWRSDAAGAAWLGQLGHNGRSGMVRTSEYEPFAPFWCNWRFDGARALADGMDADLRIYVELIFSGLSNAESANLRCVPNQVRYRLRYAPTFLGPDSSVHCEFASTAR